MIREAEHSDIPRLLVMGREFWDQTPWRVLGEFSDETAGNAFRSFIDGDSTAIFVTVDETDSAIGAVAVICGTNWMTGAPVAQELFWWVEPQAAKQAVTLWKRAEAWAAEHGAPLSMVRLNGMRDEALDRLYRMRGYEVMEHTYLRIA